MDTSEALKLVPVPALSRDMSNFGEWKFAVRFHLSYHNVGCFVEENEDGHQPDITAKIWRVEKDIGPAAPVISQDERRCRRLLAYSIIWSSAKDLIGFLKRRFGNKLQREVDQFDPKILWQIILMYHKTCGPAQYA
ncbi:hypothetical protein NEUTE1DRAFT_134215 [Neurospora tetrasperma FGSC 2508]|uniref:Retrotransposon Copia-like N-terminal domain-containing protein n=1 Tax=Neurospora tetrasperma (strain FGSC 2508 / ATCC MYA-4615 / P0657) TaxID=510951 RepID=F8MAT7_NEUT8|nr:uncharacterized protein NEUTE1DRAFT_134215 [Neurospora tetrasperma FGSC 2508]EGO60155.1 hypothetical protein NEUTE1DRAFT_134215 [Neurospora tetrasperma FGSC 2508]EGZ75890.1 hypothetical protein NEUTE2DRAFT_136955 [Neurospora tetrasperma FGSC 2509]